MRRFGIKSGADPLRPPVSLLRRIAELVAEQDDPQVREWAARLDRRFSRASIVKTYRGGRLCGYEVWRHLRSSIDDPQRHKARLWFGIRHWRSELGYEGAALDMARKAARKLEAMSRRDMAAWWKRRTQTRRSGARRLPDGHMLEVRVDYCDLQSMSHVFARR